jgi:hypothetical protein
VKYPASIAVAVLALLASGCGSREVTGDDVAAALNGPRMVLDLLQQPSLVGNCRDEGYRFTNPSTGGKRKSGDAQCSGWSWKATCW